MKTSTKLINTIKSLEENSPSFGLETFEHKNGYTNNRSHSIPKKKPFTYTELENELSKYSNRLLAICLLHASKEQRHYVLQKLKSQKRKLVEEESTFLEKLDIRYPMYSRLVNQFLDSLCGQKKSYSLPSYIRTKKYNDATLAK